MNFTLIKSMLYNLIKTYSGGIEPIWADQSEERPPRPYATMRINSGPMRIGTDDELRVSGSSFKSLGQRKFTLSVQFFGSEALEAISQLMSGLELNSARELMKTKNVGLIGVSGITNVTALLDNRYEQRYAMDLFLTCTDEAVDDVTYINSVEVTDEVNDLTQVIEGE